MWENWFSEAVADLELLELDARDGARDAVALFGGKTGVVRRLDGESGGVKWEFKDERFVFLGSESD